MNRLYADGDLPATGVYGLPEQWPHVHAILKRAGFTPSDRTEIVFLVDVSALERPVAPVAGPEVLRTLGVERNPILRGAGQPHARLPGGGHQHR